MIRFEVYIHVDNQWMETILNYNDKMLNSQSRQIQSLIYWRSEKNLLFSCQDIFRNTLVTLELFIKSLIIKTCRFGWEKPVKNIRDRESERESESKRERERGGAGISPGESLLSLSCSLSRSIFNSTIAAYIQLHMHVGSVCALLLHMTPHRCLQTHRQTYTLTVISLVR